MQYAAAAAMGRKMHQRPESSREKLNKQIRPMLDKLRLTAGTAAAAAAAGGDRNKGTSATPLSENAFKLSLDPMDREERMFV